MNPLPGPRDPVEIAVENSIEQAAETARRFLGKLLSPGLEQAGGLIGDTIGYWRFKNRVKIVLKAKRFLEEQGIEPTRVIPKTGIGILDGGSLDDDGEMQQRWAAMLANAADPNVKFEVLPYFPSILRELSPVEAAMLDWMYETDDLHKGLVVNGETKRVVSWTTVQDAAAATNLQHLIKHPMDLQVIAGNLYRLGLCELPPEREYVIDDGPEYPYLGAGDFRDYGRLILTPLGVAFVRVCRFGSKSR